MKTTPVSKTQIFDDVETALDELRRMVGLDEILDSAIDDIEHYSAIAAKSITLLNAILSCVDKTRDGDYYYVKQTGFALLPEQLSSVLADVETFLDNDEFTRRVQ